MGALLFSRLSRANLAVLAGIIYGLAPGLAVVSICALALAAMVSMLIKGAAN